jgi:hypothetical protein
MIREEPCICHEHRPVCNCDTHPTPELSSPPLWVIALAAMGVVALLALKGWG